MNARAPAHKFNLGDAVLFSPDGHDAIYQTAATGKVTRLLPKDGAEYQYHVRFEPDGPAAKGAGRPASAFGRNEDLMPGRTFR